MSETYWSHSKSIYSNLRLLFEHLTLFPVQHFQFLAFRFLCRIYMIFLLPKHSLWLFSVELEWFTVTPYSNNNGTRWFQLLKLTCSFSFLARNTGDSGKTNNVIAAIVGTMRYTFGWFEKSKYFPSKNDTINPKFINVSSIPLRAARTRSKQISVTSNGTVTGRAPPTNPINSLYNHNLKKIIKIVHMGYQSHRIRPYLDAYKK